MNLDLPTADSALNFAILALSGAVFVWTALTLTAFFCGLRGWYQRPTKALSHLVPQRSQVAGPSVFEEGDDVLDGLTLQSRFAFLRQLTAHVSDAWSRLPGIGVHLGTAAGSITTLAIAVTIPTVLDKAANGTVAMGLLMMGLSPLIRGRYITRSGLGLIGGGMFISAVFLDAGPRWLQGIQLMTLCIPIGTSIWIVAIARGSRCLEQRAAKVLIAGAMITALWDLAFMAVMDPTGSSNVGLGVSVVGLMGMSVMLKGVVEGRWTLLRGS